MSDVIIKYNETYVATLSDSRAVVMQTKGKICDDNISIKFDEESMPDDGGDVGVDENFAIMVGAKVGSIFDSEITILPAEAMCMYQDTIIGIEMTEVQDVGSSAFYACYGLLEASFPKCSVLNYRAFYLCHSLAKITSPNCTKIGHQAFADCSSLNSVNFPLCSEISNYAFNSCWYLSTATLPACTTIGTGAFAHCHNLSYVYLNSDVPYVASYTFSNNYRLKEIIHHGLDYAFPNISYISTGAFSRCYYLSTSFSSPSCLTIGNVAFYTCENIPEVYFPACTSIGTSAFYGCSNLTKINFDACRSIGSRAFYGCSKLESISFPNCISIGSSAFYNCRSLSVAYFLGSSVPRIGSNIFYNTIIESIYVPESLWNNYRTSWAAYSSLIVSYAG